MNKHNASEGAEMYITSYSINLKTENCLEIPIYRREDNIKTDFNYTGWKV
jgi:hypothetical protein